MLKRLLLGILVIAGMTAHAQKPDKVAVDTTINYDELFNAMDEFLDSLLAPHSFTMVNIGLGNSYYQYETSSSVLLESKKQLTYSPSIAYFHKNGLGVAAMANIVHDGTSMNPYQVAVTGSYDYIRNTHFITGIGYTRFFTKGALPFYTSPLQNSLNGYFMYRKLWFKPSLSVSYGWGSRTSYEDRESQITSLRLKEKGYTRVNKQESINDFSLSTAVKHDFYWLNVLNKKDYIRLTPQLTFTSGSQKFGLNQSSTTYGTTRITGSSVLYSTDQAYLDDQLYFQPLSLTATLKLQYSYQRFFVQPQLISEFYIPGSSNHMTTMFFINAGLIF
jgi:hypothetical protein